MFVEYFMVFFPNFPGGTEQSYETALRITGLWTVFETGTSKYEAVLHTQPKMNAM
jgi:hypothetical protein